MHKEQRDFCLSVKERYPQYFDGVKVLDCGSLDINGNNRYLFANCDYTGIDIGEGPNVDIVTPIHLHDAPDNTYDTIISTECFEHDRHYEKSLKNIVRMLKPGGMFLFTCATTGRPEHGTSNRKPGSSPFTNDYYKNLTREDIRQAIDLTRFKVYQFGGNARMFDLYFFGLMPL